MRHGPNTSLLFDAPFVSGDPDGVERQLVLLDTLEACLQKLTDCLGQDLTPAVMLVMNRLAHLFNDLESVLVELDQQQRAVRPEHARQLFEHTLRLFHVMHGIGRGDALEAAVLQVQLGPR